MPDTTWSNRLLKHLPKIKYS